MQTTTLTGGQALVSVAESVAIAGGGLIRSLTADMDADEVSGLVG